MEKALQGRRLACVPKALERPLADLWQRHSDDPTVLRLALRLGSEPAYARAMELVRDRRHPENVRANLIEVIGQCQKPECVPALLDAFRAAKGDGMRLAVLAAVQPFPDARISAALLELYPRLSSGVRGRVQTLLSTRPATALQLLQQVDAGRIAAKDVPLDLLQQMQRFPNDSLQKLLAKHWGKIGQQTTGEKRARINSIAHMLNLGRGDAARGHVLYQKTCATCHTLFGEGSKIGPDLTTADRGNRMFLITNIVDPSAMIRPEYVAYTVETTDGRLLTGLLIESTPQAVTLLDAKNQKTIVPRTQIEKDGLKPSPVSLMPEKLLDPFDDQQICDLFRYLQSPNIHR
jgi:putative heme-binding domain-containing protein